jgi:hypothetical protein
MPVRALVVLAQDASVEDEINLGPRDDGGRVVNVECAPIAHPKVELAILGCGTGLRFRLGWSSGHASRRSRQTKYANLHPTCRELYAALAHNQYVLPANYLAPKFSVPIHDLASSFKFFL